MDFSGQQRQERNPYSKPWWLVWCAKTSKRGPAALMRRARSTRTTRRKQNANAPWQRKRRGSHSVGTAIRLNAAIFGRLRQPLTSSFNRSLTHLPALRCRDRTTPCANEVFYCNKTPAVLSDVKHQWPHLFAAFEKSHSGGCNCYLSQTCEEHKLS